MLSGLVRSPAVRAKLAAEHTAAEIRVGLELVQGKKHTRDRGALLVEVLRSGEAREELNAREKRAALVAAADAQRSAAAAATSADATAAAAALDRAREVIAAADPAAVAAALRRVVSTMAVVPRSITAALAAYPAETAPLRRAAGSPFTAAAVAAALESGE